MNACMLACAGHHEAACGAKVCALGVVKVIHEVMKSRVNGHMMGKWGRPGQP